MSENQNETSVVSSVIVKEYKCSFKLFKSQVEKLIQDSQWRIRGEQFKVHLNGAKYLDCQANFGLRPRPQGQAYVYQFFEFKNIDEPKKNNVTKVECTLVPEQVQSLELQECKRSKLGSTGDLIYLSPIRITYDELMAPESKYLDKEGTLNLTLKITIKLDCLDESMNMAKDYKEMLANAEDYYADATIHCRDGSIRVHKNVLAARSEYFEKMLSTKMKEGLSGVIAVKEMDMSVCQTILEYIYSGSVDQGKMNVEVLAEAEKMGLINLKKECSSKLINDLSTSNCVKMIEAADLHKDENLKNKAKEFIIENYDDLSGKLKAELFLYPDIAREVFEYQRKDLPAAKRMRLN